MPRQTAVVFFRPYNVLPHRNMNMTQGLIRIRGARQHNLKNLDLDIRTGELTVEIGRAHV